MNEIARLLLTVALAGAAVTFVGSAVLWFRDETRRVRRGLRHVLKAEPEALLVARGRGRGVAFSFASRQAAVVWDAGAWGFLYAIDELMGAELIIDGHVVARVFRHEPRRALDQVVTHASRVTLRLVFDDPHHPDFDLDLWVEGDENRRGAGSPADRVQEANRWIAGCEAILRRPQAPRRAAVAPPAEAGPPPWEDDHADEADIIT
jgi:hypothetical protein